MEVKCKVKDTLPFEELTEFQGNLKERTTEDVQKIIKSIEKHGFKFPFFVWHHDGINHVLDGHGRMEALKRLVANGQHLPPLPVVYVDCRDEAEAKEALLKLNSQYGHMTPESVLEFIGDIEIDFSDLELPEGIMDLEKITKPKETTNDDEVPQLQEEQAPDSQPGQVYELGPHRLICGDATKPEDLAKLMAGAKADLVVTDPPYNVALGMDESPEEMKKRKRRTDGKVVMNDKMSDGAFLEFLKAVFSNFKNNLKNGGVYYIWHADSEGLNFRKALQETGFELRQNLIWVKNSLCLGRQDWQWRHEPCLYGWKEGAGHYWEGRRDLTTVFDEKKDYKTLSKEQLIAELQRIDKELKTTVIYEDKPSRSEEHPTMKPVRLFARLIENSSKEEDIVLDPFGGSGTTIIAAAKLNRCARVMELDPKYCDVIRRRWTAWAKENGQEVGSGGLI